MAQDLPPNTQSGDGVGGVVALVESPQAEARAPAVAAGAPIPFTGAALWTTGVLLALANFMAVLDSTITNVSVNTIAGGLAVSPTEGTWTITSYSVAEAITVPLTGWLSQRFGAVRVFTTCMLLFALFSFACGFAPSLGALIACRILQGLVGGPMIPLSQTLLLRIFPRHMAGQAIALWSMTTVVAPIGGPVLGGIICDNIGWPWIFYINVPVAIVVALLARHMLRKEETPTRLVKVDTVGLGLLVLWISAMQIMLDKGKELDWFSSPTVVMLGLVALIGFAAFMIWELTVENPIVNLRVFRHRSFATATTVMALSYGGFFAANVLIPLWLQTNMGYTASWAGKAGAFGGMLAVVFSPVVGRLVGKVDPRLMITFGISWMGALMMWRSSFASNVDFFHIVTPQFLQGLGVPFFFIPLMTLGTGSLPPDEVASGAGMISFVRTTAGAVGVSMVTTSWDDQTSTARVSLIDQGSSQVQNALQALRDTGMSAEQALRQFEGIVQSQAVMLATDRMFLVIGLILFAAGASVWLAPKPKAGARGASGGH